MKEIKKYTSIVRYGKPETANIFKKGDRITVTEKIDGVCTSFRIDEESKTGISCYSRRQILNEHDTLSGFYNWVQDNIIPIKDKLNPNYIYYGEWLCSHHVQYKLEYYKNWYMFSIWDTKKEQYVDDEIVIQEATRLGLKTVPFLYIGEFISFEHLMSFVGKSDMSLIKDKGEGIVGKNSVCRRGDNKQIFVKIVAPEFCEVMKQKPSKKPKINFELKENLEIVLTKARIRKGIFRMIEDGFLKEDYSIKNMGEILKFLGNDILEDILKEEPEMFEKFEKEEIKRYIGRIMPLTVKEIINEKIIK